MKQSPKGDKPEIDRYEMRQRALAEACRFNSLGPAQVMFLANKFYLFLLTGEPFGRDDLP